MSLMIHNVSENYRHFLIYSRLRSIFSSREDLKVTITENISENMCVYNKDDELLLQVTVGSVGQHAESLYVYLPQLTLLKDVLNFKADADFMDPTSAVNMKRFLEIANHDKENLTWGYNDQGGKSIILTLKEVDVDPFNILLHGAEKYAEILIETKGSIVNDLLYNQLICDFVFERSRLSICNVKGIKVDTLLDAYDKKFSGFKEAIYRCHENFNMVRNAIRSERQAQLTLITEILSTPILQEVFGKNATAMFDKVPRK